MNQHDFDSIRRAYENGLMWDQGATREIDTRTADEVRFADLTIVGVLPRAWPKYSHGTFTIAQAVRACDDEILPWEIEEENIFVTGDDDDTTRTH
jgi:hypothetical protein